MKRFRAVVLAGGCACVLLAQAPAPQKPKLILAVAVDQFRYDYTLRFASEYTAGFRKILEHGAVFEDAHYIHFPTVTAVGHSTFLSGATPSNSGIVANEWFDRETGKTVTSVSDAEATAVGAPGAAGASPRRLLVSTLGDEIRMQGQKTKVIGISIKDRSAILPSGHMADAAYWFDDPSKKWTTSSYYMKELPKWVEAVNAAHPDKNAEGADWRALDAKPGDAPLCSMVKGKAGVRYCGSLEASPWGNEMIEELAEKAIENENLGHHDGTDLLTVSFSSNDYVGHAVGPDAPEVRDISKRTDLLLGKLLDAVDRHVGLANVVFVLTADHGASPSPETNQARKMPGGRIGDSVFSTTIQQALEKKYGPGKWIIGSAGASMPYFDRALMAKYNAAEGDVEKTAADAVRMLPHINRVYTAEQVRNGQVPNDAAGATVVNGYYARRSADLFIVQDGFYLNGGTAGTSHGTPFNYDTHVPVIFMGPGIRPGHYYERIAVNDIAPTLAAIARVQEPSGAVGRVLREMWQ